MSDGIYNVSNSKREMSFSDFMRVNTKKGKLKVQATIAEQLIPLEGVNVVVYKDFSDGRWIFFDGVTDQSGIIDDIVLPAPPYRKPTVYDLSGASAVYEIKAENKSYKDIYRLVRVYADIRTLQPLEFESDGRSR